MQNVGRLHHFRVVKFYDKMQKHHNIRLVYSVLQGFFFKDLVVHMLSQSKK